MSAAAVQPFLVEELSSFRAPLLAEVLECAAAPRLAHLLSQAEIAGKPDDRLRERFRFARWYEQARDALVDELAEAADLGCDQRARPLHRLQRDHPEVLTDRGDDHDLRLLDRPLDRRDVAEEAHGVFHPELLGQRPQRRLERRSEK